jgi:hypothetical protein
VSGVRPDNPLFINRLADWIAVNDVAYQSYFDFNKPGDGNHRLMTGQFPAATAAYRAAF